MSYIIYGQPSILPYLNEKVYKIWECKTQHKTSWDFYEKWVKRESVRELFPLANLIFVWGFSSDCNKTVLFEF